MSWKSSKKKIINKKIHHYQNHCSQHLHRQLLDMLSVLQVRSHSVVSFFAEISSSFLSISSVKNCSVFIFCSFQGAVGGQAPATIAAPAPVVAYAGLPSWPVASFPTIVETTSSCSWTKIHNPWLHCQQVLEQHDQSDIAGALPVAQHSAVAIASHAIPAGVIIIQSSFEKNRNYPK